jgi:hypothetical protein
MIDSIDYGVVTASRLATRSRSNRSRSGRSKLRAFLSARVRNWVDTLHRAAIVPGGRGNGGG